MAKSVWLTEQEIGDLLWVDISKWFCDFDSTNKWFREFTIGRGRVDFASFCGSETRAPGIELFELKITATTDSVIQLVKYKRDLDEYLRQLFFGAYGLDHEKCPSVHINLAARYFDAKIIELCLEFGIGLWRVDVLSRNTISVDLEEIEHYPAVPHDEELFSSIKSHFGGSNGTN